MKNGFHVLVKICRFHDSHASEDGEFKIQFNHWIIGPVRFLNFFLSFWCIRGNGWKTILCWTLISQMERIQNDGEEKTFKLLLFLFEDAYISLVCTTISKSLLSINRIKNFKTPSTGRDSFKQLYYTIIPSHLSYWSAVSFIATAYSTRLSYTVLFWATTYSFEPYRTFLSYTIYFWATTYRFELHHTLLNYIAPFWATSYRYELNRPFWAIVLYITVFWATPLQLS